MSWEEALVLVMALLVAAACTWTPQLPSNMSLYVFRVLILQKSLKPACRVYVGGVLAGLGFSGQEALALKESCTSLAAHSEVRCS